MDTANGMRTITENIVASNDARIKATGKLIVDIQSMLSEFSSKRKKMSHDQKEDLGDFVKNLSDEVKNLLKEFQKNRKYMGESQAKRLAAFVKNLDKEVNTLLDNHHKEREEKFDDLKKKLAQEINGIRNNVAQIVKGAKNLMSDYKDDIGKAHSIWQDMSAGLAKSRKEGFTAGIETGEKKLDVEEYIEKKKKKRKMMHKKSMSEMKK